MCNKYEQFSKVKYKDSYDIAQKCNSFDFDFTGKVKHVQCLSCRNSCMDMEYNLTGKCNNYSKRMSLKDLNDEIKIQNLHLRKLCTKNNLHHGKMCDMLKGKRHMKFKYYIALEKAILEEREYEEYILRFEVSNG